MHETGVGGDHCANFSNLAQWSPCGAVTLDGTRTYSQPTTAPTGVPNVAQWSCWRSGRKQKKKCKKAGILMGTGLNSRQQKKQKNESRSSVPSVSSCSNWDTTEKRVVRG